MVTLLTNILLGSPIHCSDFQKGPKKQINIRQKKYGKYGLKLYMSGPKTELR